MQGFRTCIVTVCFRPLLDPSCQLSGLAGFGSRLSYLLRGLVLMFSLKPTECPAGCQTENEKCQRWREQKNANCNEIPVAVVSALKAVHN